MKLTRDLREHIEALAEQNGRPSTCPGSTVAKEVLARRIARDDGISEGLIAVLRCVEPCFSYEVGPNAETRHLELRRRWLKCYWSADDTEWASDVLFRSPRCVARLYPQLLRHGMSTFSSGDVLRFLGRKTTAAGDVHGNFVGEVLSELRRRPEGVRIKHRLNFNSIKMYDKQGSLRRVETTITHPRDIKIYRRVEGNPDGPLAWRRLRKGVSDLRAGCRFRKPRTTGTSTHWPRRTTPHHWVRWRPAVTDARL